MLMVSFLGSEMTQFQFSSSHFLYTYILYKKNYRPLSILKVILKYGMTFILE